MRYVALLMIGGLFGCATPAPAPIAPVPEAAPAVDVDALIMRDGLTSEEVELVSASYAELDGAAPQELIIHTRRLITDGSTPVDVLWLYDVSRAIDPQPIPVAPLAGSPVARVHGGLAWGPHDDHRVHRIGDIDGDGRAEIVLSTGGSSYTSPLAVLGWGRDAGGEGVIDKLWRDPGGVSAAVAADVDGDGRAELALIIAPRGVAARVVALRPDGEGMWREVEASPEVMLPAALDALVIGRPRVSVALSYVVELMRLNKLAPRDVARLQAGLEVQVAALGEGWMKRGEGSTRLGWLADAMAWPGNERAYEVLLPHVGGPAMPEFARALLELDMQTGQTRGQEALLAELDAMLGDGFNPAEGYDGQVGRFTVLLKALERYKVGAAAQRVRAAFESRELTLARGERAAALMWYVGDPRSVVASLWGSGADERLLAHFLWWFWEKMGLLDASRVGERAAWLEMFEAEVVRGWLARPALYPVAAKIALHKGDAGLRAEVWRRLGAERDGRTRATIFSEAERLSLPLPADRLVLSWLGDVPGEGRRALWRWALKVGDAALLKKMLARGATAYELEPMSPALYATGAACDVAPSGPRGCITTRGPLAGELPRLHKIMTAGLVSHHYPGKVVQMMGGLRYEPTRRLLVKLASEPGALQEVARATLILSGHVSMSEHLRASLASGASARGAFNGLGAQLEAEDAELLVAWLSAQDVAQVRDVGGALYALSDAAPRVCAADVSRLGALVDDELLSCGTRAAVASMLALCEPSWLEQVASDARLGACEGELFNAALGHMFDRGSAAHLPALERLAEDPRARYIREQAHEAAMRIKAR